MVETHNRKSHDYASNDNPYGNYHFAGQVAALFAHSSHDAGFAGRIAEKLYRLANLEGSKKSPSNESVEDTERDIAVITALWMADRRDRRFKERESKLDNDGDTKSADPISERTGTTFTFRGVPIHTCSMIPENYRNIPIAWYPTYNFCPWCGTRMKLVEANREF